jgi:hypothetical protein
MGHQQGVGEVAEVVVVDALNRRAVALTETMQMPEQFLFLGVDAQHRIAVRMGLAAQRVDVAELLVALLWIDVTGDELLAQGPAAIAGPLQELRGGVAADLKAAPQQRASQLHRLEIGPHDARIGGAAGAVRLENVVEGVLQTRLALGHLRSPAARAADAPGVAAGPTGRRAAVLVHRIELANPGVDRAPAHPQHLRNVGDPAATDLQCLDRRVAAPVVLRQGRAIQAHEILVLVTVTGKLAHPTTYTLQCEVAIVSLEAHLFNIFARTRNISGEKD